MEKLFQGDLKSLVEALLFAAPSPLSPGRICEVVPGVKKADIKRAISDLASEINRPGRGLELVEVAGGWRIQTRPSFAPWISRLRQRAGQRLSRAALETLAVIAYRQPVTRAVIEQARGVDSSGTIRHLLDRRLIRILGRKDVPGRPLLYGTTRYFLQVFQLKDIGDLPSHKELNSKEPDRQMPLFE